MEIGRSGITRMLSGSHNLTIKTMAKVLAVCGHEVRFEAVPIVWNSATVRNPVRSAARQARAYTNLHPALAV